MRGITLAGTGLAVASFMMKAGLGERGRAAEGSALALRRRGGAAPARPVP